ncbi:MAG TPA: amidohydrolase family protein, partial [Leptospiraceae bacterium]|nr:amidohydrolase family protein [Leptospiraceae bacterium]
MKPCAHSFVSEDGRRNSPFGWKNPDLPSCEDIVTHIPLLEKFGIPHIFDIHCHFFPEAVMRAVWKWFDKVNWFITYRMSAEKRIDALKRNRVGKFTTLNYAHRPGIAEGLNEWVFQNCSDISEAVLFGTFYPEESAYDYVKKAVEEYGFRGFKLHCEVSRLDLMRPELKTSFQYLEKKGIPIVIHTGTAPLPGEFTGIRFFQPFMEKYPELNV